MPSQRIFCVSPTVGTKGKIDAGVVVFEMPIVGVLIFYFFILVAPRLCAQRPCSTTFVLCPVELSMSYLSPEFAFSFWFSLPVLGPQTLASNAKTESPISKLRNLRIP